PVPLDHDFVGEREPQAGVAAPGRLRREERLEHPVLYGLGYPASVVGDGDGDGGGVPTRTHGEGGGVGATPALVPGAFVEGVEGVARKALMTAAGFVGSPTTCPDFSPEVWQ